MSQDATLLLGDMHTSHHISLKGICAVVVTREETKITAVPAEDEGGGELGA